MTTKLDSYSKLQSWFDGMHLYGWRYGFVAIKGREVVVFADGLGYREGCGPADVAIGTAQLPALRQALSRFGITDNAKPNEVDVFRSIQTALSTIDADNPDDLIMPLCGLPDCHTIHY